MKTTVGDTRPLPSGRIGAGARFRAPLWRPGAIGRVRRRMSAAPSAARSALRPVADRASATDLAFLSMDTGSVPEQFAAVLVLAPDGPFDLLRVQGLIAERVPAIPRLRQRLVRVPPGCGRPIWIDDREFDIL